MIYTIQYLHPSADVQSCHDRAPCRGSSKGTWSHTPLPQHLHIYTRSGVAATYCFGLYSTSPQSPALFNWSRTHTCSLHGDPLPHYASRHNGKCQYTQSQFSPRLTDLRHPWHTRRQHVWRHVSCCLPWYALIYDLSTLDRLTEDILLLQVSCSLSLVHNHVHWILFGTVSSDAQTYSLHGAPLPHHAPHRYLRETGIKFFIYK